MNFGIRYRRWRLQMLTQVEVLISDPFRLKSVWFRPNEALNQTPDCIVLLPKAAEEFSFVLIKKSNDVRQRMEMMSAKPKNQNQA